MDRPKKKQLTLMGEVWDDWPMIDAFDRTFISVFVSFYKPKLSGKLSTSQLITLKEKTAPGLLLVPKVLGRIIRIIGIIKKEKPDLIVSHHDEANITLTLIVLLNKIFRFTKADSFVWVRNNPLHNSSGIMKKITLFFYAHLYKYNTAVIAQNQTMKSFLSSTFKHLGTIRVIPNVYNINENRERAQQKKTTALYADFFKTKTVFLSIGRLCHQKAHASQFRAFAEACKINDSLVLLVMGDGEYKHKLVTLVKSLGMQDKIIFIGYQENAFAFISQAHVLLLTSRFEGMPNVISESLSVGTPVIATDSISGPRELLCPELPINQKISYPQHTAFGTLLGLPPSTDDWQQRAPNDFERALAETILLWSTKAKKVPKTSHINEFDVSKAPEKLIVQLLSHDSDI